MTTLILLLFLNITLRIAEADTTSLNKTFWDSCKIDADCTAVIAPCDDWKPINKDHIDDFVKANSHNFCSVYDKPKESQPVVVCFNQKCNFTNNHTGISVDQWERQHGLIR